MGREERGPPGGTAALLTFVEEHRPALVWDFRRYLHVPLSALGDSIPWGEAADLIHELLRETGSHLYADIAGLREAGSQADVATILHAEWFMNVNRDREQHADPIVLPAPFNRTEEAEDVTVEERDEATSYLAAHSALCQ